MPPASESPWLFIFLIKHMAFPLVMEAIAFKDHFIKVQNEQ